MVDSKFSFALLELAGVPVDCALRFPDTMRFLRRFSARGAADPDGAICVNEQAFRDWEAAGNKIDSFAEFCLLCQPCSEALMDSNRCVFHALALRFCDRAFLLAGGSGVGKSTHGRLLLERYPQEFSVINGDKPILELSDGGIMVHPSPWNGKEGLYSAEAAPLAGIFFLRRSDENAVRRLSDREAAVCTFPMVFQSFESEAIIRRTAAFAEQIVRRAPDYLFASREIEESSAMLYQAVKEAADNAL